MTPEERVAEIDGAIKLGPGMSKLNRMFCGCNDRNATWGEVLRVLRRCAAGTFQPNDTIADAVCDWAGLTEHGVSVRGAWLTEEGKRALAFLEERGLMWDDTGFFEDDDECCTGDPDPSRWSEPIKEPVETTAPQKPDSYSPRCEGQG